MSLVPSSVSVWASLAERHATLQGIDPALVLAVVWQESAGNPYAVRPELGFWSRYAPGIARLISQSPSKDDDRWAKHPALASASYGLMQVLYVVALELGEQLQFPTELCDPDRSLRLGCRHLAAKIRAAGGDITGGLQRWNGGGDPDYASEVLRKRADVLNAGIVRPSRADRAEPA